MTRQRIGFRTIVVATDLTDSGSYALQYAKRIALLHRAKLVVVYAIDPVGYAFPEGLPEPVAGDWGAYEVLKQIEEEIRQLDIPVHSVVETSEICEGVLQAALDHHADLLVLGTHAGAKIGRAALGMVARRLLATAPCSILTVPLAASANPASVGHWQNVLVATDFSDASLAALDCAQSIASEMLTVLHVAGAPAGQDDLRHLEWLRFLAPFNESHTKPVEHFVAQGNAAASICDHADRLHADLVVLGSPKDRLQSTVREVPGTAFGLYEKEFESSTVLQVISNVSCPVLCVPPCQKISAKKFVEALAFFEVAAEIR